MASIFLSHSSLDMPIARRIANDLKAAGHRVWLDEWEIYVGHSIAGKIQEGLEQSDFIAVLLTANSIRSGWVEKEWQSRVDKEVRRRSVEILPLRADDCEVPLLLRDKKWADLTSYESGMAEVLRALSYHSREQSAALGQSHSTTGSNRATGGQQADARTKSCQWQRGEEPSWDPALKFRQPAAKHGMAVDRNWRPRLLLGGFVLLSLLLLMSSRMTHQPGREVTPTRPSTPSLAELMKDRNYGSSMIPRRITDLVKCSPTGCSLSRRDLCSGNTKYLRLGRAEDASELSYDLQECSITDPGKSSGTACFSPADGIFPLRPGATVFASLEYSDGSRLPFQVRVETSPITFNGAAEWAELEPMHTPSQSAAPFVAAKVNLGRDYHAWPSTARAPFDVFIGIGGCPSSKPRVSKLLYDLDGRGFVEVEDISADDPFDAERVTTQFSIPRKPAQSQIAIAFDNAAGKRIGPFLYRFDVTKILQAAGREAGEPRLDCSVAQKTCAVPGKSSPLAWMQVKAIEYGAAADRLSNTLAIATPESYLLSEGARIQSKRDGVARFSIPAGWKDVYYRLLLADGSSTEVIRISLQ